MLFSNVWKDANLFIELKLFQIVNHQLMFQVAWLHSEKGIIAVYPDMVAQNDRFTSSFDNRFENKIENFIDFINFSRDSWFLMIKEVQESDAGKYICQLNTERPISISGTLSVVGTHTN